MKTGVEGGVKGGVKGCRPAPRAPYGSRPPSRRAPARTDASVAR